MLTEAFVHLEGGPADGAVIPVLDAAAGEAWPDRLFARPCECDGSGAVPLNDGTTVPCSGWWLAEQTPGEIYRFRLEDGQHSYYRYGQLGANGLTSILERELVSA